MRVVTAAAETGGGVMFPELVTVRSELRTPQYIRCTTGTGPADREIDRQTD